MDTIKNYLLALTPEDRLSLVKMGDSTEPFVSKGVEYVDKGIITLPDFVNKEILDASYQIYQSLEPLAELLTNFNSLVSDTRMLAGSNAF